MLFIVHREHEVGVEVTQQTSSSRLYEKELLEIGRGTQADLHFEDVGVDLRHATIEEADGVFVVRDRGSVTGTYLNGERVEKAALSVGDVIAIGEHPLMVRRCDLGKCLELVLLSMFQGSSAGLAGGFLPESEAPTLPSQPAPDLEEFQRRSERSRAASVDHVKLKTEEPSSGGRATGSRRKAADLGAVSSAPSGPAPVISRPTGAASGSLVNSTPPVQQARSSSSRRDMTFRPIDYSKAYGLRRLLLSKSLFSLVSILAVGLAANWVVDAGRRDFVQPGPLSSAHQLPTLSGSQNCEKCHTAFEGASSGLCEECHQGLDHSLRQTITPDCLQCHLEHRSAPQLANVDDRLCIDCHDSIELADSGPALYEPTIASFQEHPDFSLTVDGPDGTERRMPLVDAVAARRDSTVLAFNHELHLDPEEMEKVPRRHLVCADCHLDSADGRHMTIVNHESHCQECHPLIFDEDHEPAPHVAADLVAAHILKTYSEAGARPLPLAQRAKPRLLVRSRVFRRNLKQYATDEEVERQAFSAIDRLFDTGCKKCHQLAESSEGFPPDVIPPEIPIQWLPHAEFPHSRHEQVDCDVCHTNVAASSETTDILLRGIETCRPCHGGFAEPGEEEPAEEGMRQMLIAALEEPKRTATVECDSCHPYHGKE